MKASTAFPPDKNVEWAVFLGIWRNRAPENQNRGSQDETLVENPPAKPPIHPKPALPIQSLQMDREVRLFSIFAQVAIPTALTPAAPAT